MSLVYFPPGSFSPRYGDEFYSHSILGFDVVQGDGELATAGSVEDACDPMAFLKIPLSLCGLASQAYAVYKIEVRRGSPITFESTSFSLSPSLYTVVLD